MVNIVLGGRLWRGFMVFFMLLLCSFSGLAWVDNYQQRYPINCSNLTGNVPILVNGSYNFMFDGINKQSVFILCNSSIQTYLYYATPSNYSFGTDTQKIEYDVDIGNITDSALSSWIWKDYYAVYHFDKNGTGLRDSGLYGLTAAKVSNEAVLSTTNSFSGNSGYFAGSNMAAYEYGYFSGASGLDLSSAYTAMLLFRYNKTSLDDTYAVSADVFGSYSGVTNLYAGKTAGFFRALTGGIARSYGVAFDNLSYVAFSNIDGRVNLHLNNSNDFTDYSNSVAAFSGANVSFWIGCDPGVKKGSFNGWMDEVRFYKGNMTKKMMTDILRNFNRVSGYGELGALENKCIPSWSCSLYQGCNQNNTNPCLNVSDGNSCGQTFPGNFSSYDLSCVYPKVPTADLTSVSGVFLIGILIFFWLGLAIAGLAFRSFALMSFMWILGVIIGMMVISLSFVLSIAFILISTIMIMIGRK